MNLPQPMFGVNGLARNYKATLSFLAGRVPTQEREDVAVVAPERAGWDYATLNRLGWVLIAVFLPSALLLLLGAAQQMGLVSAVPVSTVKTVPVARVAKPVAAPVVSNTAIIQARIGAGEDRKGQSEIRYNLTEKAAAKVDMKTVQADPMERVRALRAECGKILAAGGVGYGERYNRCIEEPNRLVRPLYEAHMKESRAYWSAMAQKAGVKPVD